MSKLQLEDKIWLNWAEINRIAQNKKIIFFGRGVWMEKTINYLVSKAAYIVDNSTYEHGEIEHGLMINNPEKLKFEDKNNFFVIITNTSINDVSKQLIKYGFSPGQHFCASPSLTNIASISRINNHDQTIYLTCSDPYDKNNLNNGGGFYSFNLQSRKTKKLLNGMCHGIVEGKDCFYLVNDLIGINILDEKFNKINSFGLPAKSRPHGIAYCHKRDLLFINLSGRDSISIYNAKNYKQIDEIFLSDKWKKTGSPQHHINDLCVLEDSLFVSMFSFSGNWKSEIFDGGILEFDINSMQKKAPIVSDLWMPHTPTIINDTLFYCNSMYGTVHAGTSKKIAVFNGFVRGIAFDGNYYYIGQSAHRYIDRLKGISNNISLDSGIYILDDKDKVTKFFLLPHLNDINTILIPSF